MVVTGEMNHGEIIQKGIEDFRNIQSICFLPKKKMPQRHTLT